MKDVDAEFFMRKKHYFFNSIYLFLCLSFIIVASFLNYHDSIAKQELPLNTDFHLEDQEAKEDSSLPEYNIRQKAQNKYESNIASSYLSAKVSYGYVAAPAQTAAPAQRTYSSYISIAGRVLRIEDVNDTLIDSTDHVNRWGKKFLYGHNTSSVFGPIRNLTSGATFTVLMDGEEHIYQILYVETMERSKVEQNMLGIAYAKYGGKRYDLSLMTCAGTSLGGGDATHRFVVFANKIS